MNRLQMIKKILDLNYGDFAKNKNAQVAESILDVFNNVPEVQEEQRVQTEAYNKEMLEQAKAFYKKSGSRLDTVAYLKRHTGWSVTQCMNILGFKTD